MAIKERLEKRHSTKGQPEKRHYNKGQPEQARPEKKRPSRSNPKIEYILDDATPEERILITKGGIVDRINTLSLLCARNPSPDNYKQLLYFAKDQRNDVIYLVLKNLRDLVKEKIPDDFYIKGRIVKSFEMGIKNQYIKDKVIEIVGVLIRAGVYQEEFVSILVERLGEKGEVQTFIHEALQSVFHRFEELIVRCTEDFYYKNDNFKAQYYALRFLRKMEPVDKSIHFSFYDQALTTLDETYFDNQKDLLMNQIITGLANSYVQGSTITSINKVRECISSPQVTASALQLLVRTRDEQVGLFVLRAAKSMCLRGTPQECVLLNYVEEIVDSGIGDGSALLGKLLNSCLYYTDEYIISLLLIASKMKLARQPVLWILVRHYHPIIRDMAAAQIRGEELVMFDPYDRVLMANKGALAML